MSKKKKKRTVRQKQNKQKPFTKNSSIIICYAPSKNKKKKFGLER